MGEEPLADDEEVGALPLTSTDKGQRRLRLTLLVEKDLECEAILAWANRHREVIYHSGSVEHSRQWIPAILEEEYEGSTVAELWNEDIKPRLSALEHHPRSRTLLQNEFLREDYDKHRTLEEMRAERLRERTTDYALSGSITVTAILGMAIFFYTNSPR